MGRMRNQVEERVKIGFKLFKNRKNMQGFARSNLYRKGEGGLKPKNVYYNYNY